MNEPDQRRGFPIFGMQQGFVEHRVAKVAPRVRRKHGGQSGKPQPLNKQRRRQGRLEDWRSAAPDCAAKRPASRMVEKRRSQIAGLRFHLEAGASPRNAEMENDMRIEPLDKAARLKSGIAPVGRQSRGKDRGARHGTGASLRQMID